MVAHPDIGQRLSFLFFGLALLLVSQPVAVYHLTHSITSAVGSLLPEVSHLKSYNCASIPAEGNGNVPEWAGSHCRLKNTHQLFQPSSASGSFAQIFSYTIFKQELWQHVRMAQLSVAPLRREANGLGPLEIDRGHPTVIYSRANPTRNPVMD